MVLEEGTLPGGHRYRIEHTDPEGDAKMIALRIKDAINGEAVANKNADYYRGEIRRLNREIDKLGDLLARIEARDRGEHIEPRGRMDPVRTYEARAIEEQLQRLRQDRDRYQEIVDGSLSEAKRSQQEYKRANKDMVRLRADNGISR